MNKQESTTTTVSWDSEFGEARASIVGGYLTKVKIHKDGIAEDRDLLRAMGADVEPFVRHVHKCLTELLEVLAEPDGKE